MAFDWSLSGFEFEAECEGKVLATITGTPGWQKVGFIQVTVDGVAGERVAIEPGRQDYLLADALPKGRHKITVCKLNEAQYSKMALESLTLSGTLLAAPAPAALKMEFIGDSITCAEGALGKMPDVPQGESQDAARSFASLTARSLGAEASIVAASSWGLHRGRIAPEEKSVIPAIFELTSRFRDPSAAWDFTKYQPDLVVVNLGTNDFSGRKKTPFTDAEFQEAIERFHLVLRSRYPTAHIFWVTGMMLPDADGPTLAAVEKIRASDAKTYFAKLPQNNGGGNGHPDLDGHQKAAAALTAKIRESIPNLAESAPGS
ncbi:MAG: GDSL-type esterase/lipase family protein [Terrimicrobiaceae bacterium]